jgi:hypothetical protein
VRSRSSQVGVSLTIPLYAGGGVQARVREALALKGKAEEDLEAARRLAATQARQAFAGVVNGAAQVQALGSAIVSSKSSLDANKVGYLVGTRINMEVLNAEQQLYTAQRDWHKARAETLVQGLRLKAANATLGEADLAAINDMLETAQAMTSASPNSRGMHPASRHEQIFQSSLGRSSPLVPAKIFRQSTLSHFMPRPGAILCCVFSAVLRIPSAAAAIDLAMKRQDIFNDTHCSFFGISLGSRSDESEQRVSPTAIQVIASSGILTRR